MTQLNDKKLLSALRHDIDDALKGVGQKHNLTLKSGSITYDKHGRSATIKLEVAANGDDGQAVDPHRMKFATAWANSHFLFSLPKDGLGRKFKSGGKEYTIVGLNPKAGRYPVMAERDGKTYKFNDDDVRAVLERAAAVAGLADQAAARPPVSAD